MNLLQAIVLGIVQGLTEFIPISSTAHLVFASRWTNIYNGNPQQITATMAVIQLGTLAAVFVYFASDIWNISIEFIRDNLNLLRGRQTAALSSSMDTTGRFSPEGRLGWLIILGSIPIGTVGFLLKDVIEGEATKNLWVIAIMLIVIAVFLGIAEFVGTQRKDFHHLGIIDAIVVGFSQVLALMPGASRSGSTIMGGLFAGEKRETAARFSFLLSIPAITASGLLELRQALKILSPDSLVALLVGTVVSFIVGYLSIWFLMAFLRKHSTFIFIAYRIILGTILLILLWQGAISARV